MCWWNKSLPHLQQIFLSCCSIVVWLRKMIFGNSHRFLFLISSRQTQRSVLPLDAAPPGTTTSGAQTAVRTQAFRWSPAQSGAIHLISQMNQSAVWPGANRIPYLKQVLGGEAWAPNWVSPVQGLRLRLQRTAAHWKSTVMVCSTKHKTMASRWHRCLG